MERNEDLHWDVIMEVKFKFEIFQRFGCHCGSKFNLSHWLCTWALLTSVQHYRAACDTDCDDGHQQ